MVCFKPQWLLCIMVTPLTCSVVLKIYYIKDLASSLWQINNVHIHFASYFTEKQNIFFYFWHLNWSYYLFDKAMDRNDVQEILRLNYRETLNFIGGSLKHLLWENIKSQTIQRLSCCEKKKGKLTGWEMPWKKERMLDIRIYFNHSS